MHPIKNIVNQSVKKAGADKSIEAAGVVEAVEKIIEKLFGTEMAKYIKPLYLKNRTLTVSCTNSTVAQELKLQEPEILGQLTDKLGGKLVDRIRYFA